MKIRDKNGCVYQKGTRAYMQFWEPRTQRWKQKSSGFSWADKAKAEVALAKLNQLIAADDEIFGSAPGTTRTVRDYFLRWMEKRKLMPNTDWKNDDGRIRIHLLPEIGDMDLVGVRPRHLVEAFAKLRSRMKRKHGASIIALAPRTIRNIYSSLCAMFRDAKLDDLLLGDSPCILTEHQLGENHDKDPEWRDTAQYTREELEAFITDPRLLWDRRVLYALLGIGALRHGEAAGLRWRHYDPNRKPSAPSRCARAMRSRSRTRSPSGRCLSTRCWRRSWPSGS